MRQGTYATFSGDLTYSGSGTPASDLSLTATLVSAQQTVGTEVSVDAAGAVTVNYPTTSYCGDVATAVQKYSNLTGTSSYNLKSFSLTQQTAFLNFVITFEDGTTTGTELSAVVSNNSAAICTANVTTTTESEKVVAKFVLPVAKGTTLSSANVKFGDKAAISFGASQTLDGKVYNVTKTQAAAAYTMAANAVAGDVGKLICTDGHIHTYNADAACTKSRVAKIIYIGTTGHATYSHGLALALTDEGQMTWGAAMTACNTTKNTNTPVTDATWQLPSKDQWNKMITEAGGYTALLAGFSGISGASNLQSTDYWSSTEHEDYPNYAWGYNFVYGYWNDVSKGYGANRVRACLAF